MLLGVAAVAALESFRRGADRSPFPFVNSKGRLIATAVLPELVEFTRMGSAAGVAVMTPSIESGEAVLCEA